MECKNRLSRKLWKNTEWKIFAFVSTEGRIVLLCFTWYMPSSKRNFLIKISPFVACISVEKTLFLKWNFLSNKRQRGERHLHQRMEKMLNAFMYKMQENDIAFSTTHCHSVCDVMISLVDWSFFIFLSNNDYTL